jgi:hypothetical protein
MRPPRCRFPSRHARESASKAFGHPKLIERLFFGKVNLRIIELACVAVGLCMAQSVPASAACVVLAGTADGFDKDTAVSRAQLALDDYIKQYKAENHLGAVTVSAMRAAPQPYWRGRVSENMMYHPDIVTEKILHGLLAGRGLDLCLHFRCAGLLVAFLSKRGS